MRFGPAGIPLSTQERSSVKGIARVRALRLDAMELQFVRRVALSDRSAHKIYQAAKENNVHLSAHAPYYINFNSKDPEKVAASYQRLLKAARAAAVCGARNVVFHPAFYHDDPPPVVYKRVKVQLSTLVKQIRDEHLDICLRPETAGKPSQFGSLDEILQLSSEIDGVSPCIDFAHLHARSGGAINTYAEFEAVFDRVTQFLGNRALQDMHIHLQGIAYTAAGEHKHLTFAVSDMRYEELLHILIDRNIDGTIICESPNREEDTLLLKHTYYQLQSETPRPHT